MGERLLFDGGPGGGHVGSGSLNAAAGKGHEIRSMRNPHLSVEAFVLGAAKTLL